MPFQPNRTRTARANPRAGQDDAILYGASIQDPGGLPMGTLEYLTLLDRFYNAPGEPFDGHAAPALRLAGTLAAGHGDADGAGRLDGHAGPKPVGRGRPRTARRPSTFTVTPSASAAVERQLQASRRSTRDRRDDGLHGRRRARRPGRRGPLPALGQVGRVRLAGSTDTRAAGARLGRSAAVQSMGAGETITVPVDVHNWSTVPQTGDVTPGPAGRPVTADATPSRTARWRRGRGHDRRLRGLEPFTNATLPGAAGNAQTTT